MSEVDPNKKAPFGLRKWTKRSKVKLSFKHSVPFFWGSGLVSSAAAAPNLHRKAFIWDWFQSACAGVGERGTEGWFPSGTQASSQSIWLKASLAQLHTMTRSCTEINCGQPREGATMCSTPGALPCIHSKTSLSVNSRFCQQCLPLRVSSSVTRDWVGKTVGSAPLGQAYVLSDRQDE